MFSWQKALKAILNNHGFPRRRPIVRGNVLGRKDNSMSKDEIIAELIAIKRSQKASEAREYELELRLKHGVFDSKASKPVKKTKIEKYIEQNKKELWEEAFGILKMDEVGTSEALEFLGNTVASNDFGEQINKKKLRLLLSEGVLRPGKSYSPGSKNTYCTMSLVDFVRLGEETLRNNAQSSKIKNRNMDSRGNL